MALGQQLRNAIGTVWRAAVGAAAAGLSAYQTISQNIGQALRSGTGETIIEPATLQQIATYATGWEAAKQAFSSATPEQAVDASMIAFAPWSMTVTDLNATPSYDLNIGYSVPGLPEVQYKVLAGLSDLPDTVQDVVDLALANTESLLGRYLTGTALAASANATVDSVTITVGRPLAA